MDEWQQRAERRVTDHPHFLLLATPSSKRAPVIHHPDADFQPDSGPDWSWSSYVEEFYRRCFECGFKDSEFDEWVNALYERLREAHDANALWIIEWFAGDARTKRWLPFIRLPTYTLAQAIRRMRFMLTDGKPTFIKPAVFPAEPDPPLPSLRVRHLLTGAIVIC